MSKFCSCPACGVAFLLLKTDLLRRGEKHADLDRITIRGSDCGDGSYPYLASVRVDEREVFRIEKRPTEIFAPDVIHDIRQALRRPTPC